MENINIDNDTYSTGVDSSNFWELPQEDLIGKIGNGLNSEYEDAERLQNSIEDILALPKAKGASWEAERVRLRKLADCCSARKLAVTTLEEAYIEALTLIRDYIGDDAYLDDGELDTL